MPLLLIGVRENRWHKEPAAGYLALGDVPADPLGDLRTSKNCLSVWAVLDDRSNLLRIVRALAIGKPKLDNSGYVVFDSDLLSAAGIDAPKLIPGTTHDTGANGWHRDLVNLSGNTLVRLTHGILEHGETGQVLKKALIASIKQGIASKELPDKLLRLFPKELGNN
jgi:hypothetical protein